MSDFACSILAETRATVVTISGQITFAEASDFSAHLARAISEKPQRLVLDFSAVSVITSAGIGVLLKLHQDVSKWDCQLWLVGLRPGVAEIITGSRLDQILDIAASIDDALSD